ncbi:MAG: GAF domain-containing protein [Acidobacteriota bacterium]|nr:GAF domain-containing protein [Acidobacteriota bacterium]
MTATRPPQATRLARRQAALLRLSTAIVAAGTERDVYHAMVGGLHDEALGYNFLGVFIIDAATGDRVLQASRGWKDVPADWRVHAGEGISRRAVEDGKLHYTPDVTRDAAYLPSLNSGSEVDVPLRVDGRTIGVLVVESAEPDAFGDEDFEILSAAADQASLAIGRARLLMAERRRAEEHKALLDTMKDLAGELDLPRVLQAVIARAVTLLGVTGGEVAILDEETNELIVVASEHIGKDSSGTRLKMGEGAMGTVARTLEPLIIPSYKEWLGQSAKYADVLVHSVMAAPLLIGRRLVGAIATVHSDPARVFNHEDLRLLNLFAPQAAIAIENARLFDAANRQRQYFETLVSNSPVAIVALDANANITTCNPAFQRLFGYSLAEMLGRDLDSLINTEGTLSEAVQYTEGALVGPVHGVGRRTRKDGSPVDVEILGVPVFVEGERIGLMALYHDVTELLQARREAEAASSAKSQFLASMSHELRTPLNAIIGYSEMILEDGETSGAGEFAGDVRKIHTAGKHLLSLINDVLDLSKIEAGKMEIYPESFDVAAMLEDVLNTARPLAATRGNTLSADARGDLGTMHSDLTKVRQMLLNLLSNACKFTEKGTVRLVARRVTGSGPGLDSMIFEVADTGIGMTPEQLTRIFDAFSQAEASTSRRFGGTGLGLAITKRFCTMLDGDLGVESRAGAGTTFSLRLPAVVNAAAVS